MGSKCVDENAKLQGKAGHRVAPPPSAEAAPESTVIFTRGEPLAHTSFFVSKHDTFALKASKFNSERSRISPANFHTGSLDVLKLNGFRLGLRSLEQEGIVASFVQDLFPLGRLTLQHSFIGSWLWHVVAFCHTNNYSNHC
jgi:hypothetical protein